MDKFLVNQLMLMAGPFLLGLAIVVISLLDKYGDRFIEEEKSNTSKKVNLSK